MLQRKTSPGQRTGQQHPKATLTDDQVREVRRLNSLEKSAGRLGYRQLAKQFNCGESTIRDFCTYRTRRSA